MIKVGVIGGGKWGRNHLKDLYQMNCSLVGLADPDPNKKELAEEHNIQYFSDYRLMLPHVDAVTVVTPTTTHYEIAKYCLEQGKHVLVEKPLCFNLEEAKELVNLTQAKNLILSVGYVFRFNPLVKRLKELLPEIGEIQYITGKYVHSTVPPRKDSGVIFNLAVHLIDVLNHVLPHKPKNIFCRQINQISPAHEDSAILTIDYGKFPAIIETSCCHPEKKRDMWIIASKEKLYFDFLDQVLIRFPILVSEEGTIKKDSFRDPKIEKKQPLFEELWHFIQVCEKKMKNEEINNESAENSLTTKMCLLALQSSRENCIIKVG